MLLLQVLLLLVVVMGWFYETSLTCAMCRIPSSLPNSEKIKLPATPLLLRHLGFKLYLSYPITLQKFTVFGGPLLFMNILAFLSGGILQLLVPTFFFNFSDL
jgi:hypothetical protein